MKPDLPHRLLPLALLLLGLGAAVSACASAAQPVPPTAAPTITQPPPTLTPTPALRLELQESSLTADPQGLLFLGTFENPLDTPLSGLRLQLELLRPDGAPAAGRTVQPVPGSLAPGATAGLWARFDAADHTLTPALQVVASTGDPVPSTDIEVAVLGAYGGGAGPTTILGTLTSHMAGYARLEDVLLLPRAFGRGPQAAAVLSLANQGIAPGESVPFAAEVQGEQPPQNWQAYVAAVPSGQPDSPALDLVSGPEPARTAQGRIFYTLQLQNTGSLPRWAAGMLAFFQDGELQALARLSTPLPLAPGETRAFAITEFAGADPATDPTQQAALSWDAELVLDALGSRPVLREIRSLELSVEQFEVIGELLFLRGELTNSGSGAVEGPSALIIARDIHGRLLNSAWATPVERLEPGASAAFELTMLLPAGTSAELSEFDLQGAGLAAGQP